MHLYLTFDLQLVSRFDLLKGLLKQLEFYECFKTPTLLRGITWEQCVSLFENIEMERTALNSYFSRITNLLKMIHRCAQDLNLIVNIK